jgi:hypothetical protein
MNQIAALLVEHFEINANTNLSNCLRSSAQTPGERVEALSSFKQSAAWYLSVQAVTRRCKIHTLRNTRRGD